MGLNETYEIDSFAGKEEFNNIKSYLCLHECLPFNGGQLLFKIVFIAYFFV